VQIGETQPGIAAVRRLLASRDQQIRELEALFVELCERNQEIHLRGQQHIAQLEREIESLRRLPLVRPARNLWNRLRRWGLP
jgi:hypothetical protein